MATANRPEAPEPHGLHDRDFDLSRGEAGRPRVVRPVSPEYQRLVANPFLGLLGLIAWGWALTGAVAARRFDFAMPVAASVLGVHFLLQFHCLDCGRTDRLSRWRGHVCTRVQDRLAAGRPRRFRGPSPGRQMFLWAVGLVAACLFWSIVMQ